MTLINIARNSPLNVITQRRSTSLNVTALPPSPRAQVFQEEIFGPVTGVVTFKTEDEAIAIANDTIYGLGAGVWTRDAHQMYTVRSPPATVKPPSIRPSCTLRASVQCPDCTGVACRRLSTPLPPHAAGAARHPGGPRLGQLVRGYVAPAAHTYPANPTAPGPGVRLPPARLARPRAQATTPTRRTPRSAATRSRASAARRTR